jgi:phage terminase large subunit-like protein
MAGLYLDDWQQFVLRESLGRRDGGDGEDGRQWAAFEVCAIVARQNGKGALLEARELAGLFLFGDERLILHSAHEFKTASEAFRRILGLIQDCRPLARHVKHVYLQRGAESIELDNGKRLRFVARSSGSGRGFSADLVILDEAQKLGDESMAALLPTLSARKNPQVLYTATAGNETSTQLGRVRERGLAGEDPSLAFFEWSAGESDDPDDPVTWRKANPGLGIRITEDYVRRERAALGPDEFARERLSVGRYPTDLADAWQVIPRAAWLALADPQSEPLEPVTFAAAFSDKRDFAAIGVAGRRSDGLLHCEVTDYRPGTAWAASRLIELCRKHSPGAVVIDAGGHEASMIGELEAAGVEVTKPQVRQVAAAFGQFFEAVTDSRSLRHLGQPVLDSALAAAVTREVGDAGRTWGRRRAAGDISPLVAVTLAAWAAAAGPQSFFGSWR